MSGPIRPIADGVRQRLEALKAGEESTGSAIPEDVRAAIHAGHVAQVVIFCDDCGIEHRGDYIGASREERFAAARVYLATQEWRISETEDLCPDHTEETQ